MIILAMPYDVFMRLHEFVLVISSKDLTQMVEYVGSEEVSTSVYGAADKRSWLFHIVKNLGWMCACIFASIIT